MFGTLRVRVLMILHYLRAFGEMDLAGKVPDPIIDLLP